MSSGNTSNNNHEKNSVGTAGVGTGLTTGKWYRTYCTACTEWTLFLHDHTNTNGGDVVRCHQCQLFIALRAPWEGPRSNPGDALAAAVGSEAPGQNSSHAADDGSAEASGNSVAVAGCGGGGEAHSRLLVNPEWVCDCDPPDAQAQLYATVDQQNGLEGFSAGANKPSRFDYSDERMVQNYAFLRVGFKCLKAVFLGPKMAPDEFTGRQWIPGNRGFLDVFVNAHSTGKGRFVFVAPGAGTVVVPFSLIIFLTAGFMWITTNWVETLSIEASLAKVPIHGHGTQAELDESWAKWLLFYRLLFFVWFPISILFVLGFMYKVTTTDPGYVIAPAQPFQESRQRKQQQLERQQQQEQEEGAEEEIEDVPPPENDEESLLLGGKKINNENKKKDTSAENYRHVTCNKKPVFQRFCRQCDQWTHLRSVHCKTCGVCVVGWDHHCRVLGCCVGYHNLRWFAGFLLCVSASNFVGTVTTITILARTGVHYVGESVSHFVDKAENDLWHHHQTPDPAPGDNHNVHESSIYYNLWLAMYATMVGTVWMGVSLQLCSVLFCTFRGLTYFEMARGLYQGRQERVRKQKCNPEAGGGCHAPQGGQKDQPPPDLDENPFDAGCVRNFKRAAFPQLWHPDDPTHL